MTGRARTKDEGQGQRMKDKDEGSQRPTEVHDRAEPWALLQILYF